MSDEELHLSDEELQQSALDLSTATQRAYDCDPEANSSRSRINTPIT